MTGRSGDTAGAVDGVLSALADPTRRRLLDLLAAHGEITATTLAGHLPVSRQAVVKHLAVLDAAGLVAGRRVGREVRYAVQPAALDTTARWMATLAAEWDRRLATVKRIAEEAERASRPREASGTEHEPGTQHSSGPRPASPPERAAQGVEPARQTPRPMEGNRS
jgi:DNA-binding transcriptional ArsR family regulator